MLHRPSSEENATAGGQGNVLRKKVTAELAGGGTTALGTMAAVLLLECSVAPLLGLWTPGLHVGGAAPIVEAPCRWHAPCQTVWCIVWHRLEIGKYECARLLMAVYVDQTNIASAATNDVMQVKDAGKHKHCGNPQPQSAMNGVCSTQRQRTSNAVQWTWLCRWTRL